MRHPEIIDRSLDVKIAALESRLLELGPIAVALSGGVDSTLLLCEAHRLIGNRAVAVTGVSASLSKSELREAQRVAQHVGSRLIELQTRELEVAEYRANRGDRCFHCKHELYGSMARHEQLVGFTVIDGTHAEDPAGDRPGMRAAVALGVVSPLRDVGFGKSDIRALARRRNLPNWDRPARPCLASRVAIGTEVDSQILADVEAFESVLAGHGFHVYRARVAKARVLVEVGMDEVNRLDEPAWREEFARVATARGYRDVSANRSGYGSGLEPRPVSIQSESPHG